MTFKDSLHIVSTDIFARLIFPKWAMVFTAKLRKIRLAFDELEVSTSPLALSFVILNTFSTC